MDPWERSWADYYEDLGVAASASIGVIKAAYRVMAQEYHPDGRVHADTERMTRINAAYEVLSDTDKRRRYDIAYRVRRAEPIRQVKSAPAQPRKTSTTTAPPTYAPPNRSTPHDSTPGKTSNPSAKQELGPVQWARVVLFLMMIAFLSCIFVCLMTASASWSGH